jgi:glycosyltransferase involved in cell wall biosynthesis
MLGSGAGEVVDHDADAMAAAVRRLLDDPESHMRATSIAADGSAQLNWARVTDQYARLIRGLVPALATA